MKLDHLSSTSSILMKGSSKCQQLQHVDPCLVMRFYCFHFHWLHAMEYTYLYGMSFVSNVTGATFLMSIAFIGQTMLTCMHNMPTFMHNNHPYKHNISPWMHISALCRHACHHACTHGNMPKHTHEKCVLTCIVYICQHTMPCQHAIMHAQHACTTSSMYS